MSAARSIRRAKDTCGSRERKDGFAVGAARTGSRRSPKSILTAEVKHEDFPFALRNEKTDFIECMRSRSQTLEDAEVGHRASTVVQMGYIACLLGRKLTWDPVKEEFPGDDEANKLVQGHAGVPPWTIE